MAVYWIIFTLCSLGIAYVILFIAVPFIQNIVRDFTSRVTHTLTTTPPSPPSSHFSPAPLPPQASVKPPEPVSVELPQESHEMHHVYSPYEGFKSFARNGALSIEDIVKGLSRGHYAPIIEPDTHSVNVEPVYENVETIAPAPAMIPSTTMTPDIRGFISALITGDRSAVFAGLRQYVRGAGTPEHLISSVVTLFDNAYRARIDGGVVDGDTERLFARLDTETLEKLIGALATAVDASYSDSVTGAKLALMRALTVLGA
jgi:hypothetical protein